jgi:hypothetical protein
VLDIVQLIASRPVPGRVGEVGERKFRGLNDGENALLQYQKSHQYAYFIWEFTPSHLQVG